MPRTSSPLTYFKRPRARSGVGDVPPVVAELGDDGGRCLPEPSGGSPSLGLSRLICGSSAWDPELQLIARLCAGSARAVLQTSSANALPRTTVLLITASTRTRRRSHVGKHGDGKGGEEGDKQQSPRESDGQWTKPVTDPPKKK